MTLWKEINDIPCTKEALRKFGLTLGIVFGLIGGWTAWRGHGVWPYFLGAGGFFLAFGLILPFTLKPFQKVWMTLALLMGWVMSRLILTVVFYLVLTPIGCVMRLARKDLLDTQWPGKKASYWVARRIRVKEDYENQF